MTNEEALSMLKMRLTLHDDDKDIFSDEMKKVLEKDKEAIKMAISALERDRWIPVTENPKHDDTYLVTLDGEICGQDEPIASMCGYFDGKWDEESVLAWRPLPEPYHPQELKYADADTAQGGLQPAT